MKQKVSKKVNEKIINGTFNGWPTRNIESYPEKFWKCVLQNNNIEYKFNYPLKHNNSNYFLDFYIVKNNSKIDLEIDGKQHLYEDRIASDKIRDNYVISNNICVYRIKWNEINTDYGKELMNKKINDFINWYDKI